MYDFTKDFSSLAIAIYESNKVKGFWDEPNLTAKFNLVNSEMFEFYEAFRKGVPSFSHRYWKDGEADFTISQVKANPKAYGIFLKDKVVEEELADVFIRLMDIIGYLLVKDRGEFEAFTAHERELRKELQTISLQSSAHIVTRLRYAIAKKHNYGEHFTTPLNLVDIHKEVAYIVRHIAPMCFCVQWGIGQLLSDTVDVMQLFLASFTQYDILLHAELKLLYNDTRGEMHGGKKF